MEPTCAAFYPQIGRPAVAGRPIPESFNLDKDFPISQERQLIGSLGFAWEPGPNFQTECLLGGTPKRPLPANEQPSELLRPAIPPGGTALRTNRPRVIHPTALAAPSCNGIVSSIDIFVKVRHNSMRKE